MAGLEGFKPGMTESKSVALPLGYTPMIFFGFLTKKSGGNHILPLREEYITNQQIIFIKMVEGGRFELPNPKERIYSPPRLATSLPLQKWCRQEDLNPQPTDYKSVALPIELHRHIKWWIDDGIEPPTLCL